MDVSVADGAEAVASPTRLVSFAIGDGPHGVDRDGFVRDRGWCDVTRLPKQPDCPRGAAACAMDRRGPLAAEMP
jgi:hypothetical protein